MLYKELKDSVEEGVDFGRNRGHGGRKPTGERLGSQVTPPVDFFLESVGPGLVHLKTSFWL